MIHLENIKKTDDYVSANYKFDYGDKSGSMRLKISDGTIEKKGDSGYGISHVENALNNFSKMENLPSEYDIYWY